MRFATISLALALSACSGGKDTADDTASGTNPTVTDGVTCEGDFCVLSGTITEDVTLTADMPWLLRGGVFIGDDINETVLTIEPGTTIYGESSTDGMLVITRGSKIMAQGTADAPIVFTSSKEEGSRARGDWGGLIINGKAPVNACAEGGEGCESYGEGGTGWYGGSDPNDDSGVLNYVRVEFAGTLISPDNELNGIAFQAVGAGTEIDYVQIHQNADDGVEFFGGTAEARHLLITAVGDDMLDWTDGWTGKVQYAVLQQWDDAGDNGIEADNNGENNDATPRSAPTLSNFTIIGSPDASSSDDGMLLREGTAGDLHNMVVVGWNEACLDIDNTVTFDNASAGTLSIQNSILDCAAPVLTGDEDFDGDEIEDPDPIDLTGWFTGQTGNELGSAGLDNPYDAANPAYAPTAGSAASMGGVAPGDAFFDAVDFRGAMAPGDDWTAGWTTHAAN
jgi:hypothetical protein